MTSNKEMREQKGNYLRRERGNQRRCEEKVQSFLRGKRDLTKALKPTLTKKKKSRVLLKKRRRLRCEARRDQKKGQSPVKGITRRIRGPKSAKNHSWSRTPQKRKRGRCREMGEWKIAIHREKLRTGVS